MRINGVEERGTGNAICPSGSHETSRVGRPCITADHIVSSTARVIRIINTELCLIEDVECFSSEFHLAELGYLEMFQQSDIEVYASWIVQEISTGVAKSQPTWSYKLRRITEEW